MSEIMKPVGFCGNCGSQVYAGQKFCSQCGTQINLSDNLPNSTNLKTTIVSAPKPTSHTSIPKSQQFKGHGQKVSPKFALVQGLATFRMTHDGRRNFSIWLLDQQGNRVALLVNKVGDFSGAKALGIKRLGVYILDITADGNWTVKYEQ